MSVLRVPNQTDLSQAYSQQSLHRSVSQLIDRKSLMMEEGSWDNPLGHDSGLVSTFMLDPYVWLQLQWKSIIGDFSPDRPPHTGTFTLRSRDQWGKLLLWNLIFVCCCTHTAKSRAVSSVKRHQRMCSSCQKSLLWSHVFPFSMWRKRRLWML